MTRFRLAPLLRLRTKLEDAARAALGEAIAARAAATATVELVLARRTTEEEALRTAVGPETVGLIHSLSDTARRLDLARTALADADLVVAIRRSELRRAKAERNVIERLRERRDQEAREERERAEIVGALEIATLARAYREEPTS